MTTFIWNFGRDVIYEIRRVRHIVCFWISGETNAYRFIVENMHIFQLYCKCLPLNC